MRGWIVMVRMLVWQAYCNSLRMRFHFMCLRMQVLYMLGDIAAGPAYRFSQWLELVRKHSLEHRSSGFPHRPPRCIPFPFNLFDKQKHLSHDASFEF